MNRNILFDSITSIYADPQYNSCSVEEEVWSDLGEGLEFVYSQFIPGSIVWAKMECYPWWPAMLEEDPDDEVYYETEGGSNIPVRHYHNVSKHYSLTPLLRRGTMWCSLMFQCQGLGYTNSMFTSSMMRAHHQIMGRYVPTTSNNSIL